MKWTVEDYPPTVAMMASGHLPVPTQPLPTQPMPTQAMPTQPMPTQPMPTQPMPTQPMPTHSMPTQPMPTQPQPIRHQLSPSMEYGRPLARSQDDERVNYFCQRPNDNDFTYDKTQRWALGDDSVIDVSLPVVGWTAEGEFPNVSAAQVYGGDAVSRGDVVTTMVRPWTPGRDSVVYTGYRDNTRSWAGASRRVSSENNSIEHQCVRINLPTMKTNIAPSAKKLWGVEEGKPDNKGIFNIGEQTWRDTAWSTGPAADHGVGQHALSMGVGQRGPGRQFPGGDSVLSPRASEAAGVGVKMVEYLLASSPTGKDALESAHQRIATLSLRNGASEVVKDKKDKAPSPFDPSKKDVENGNAPQANGIQNGLDDDKAFNRIYPQHDTIEVQTKHPCRTPGSRQGSPSEEDVNKNGVVVSVKDELVGSTVGGVVMGQGGQVLGPLDHSSFDGVGGGMGSGVGGGGMGGVGNAAGILDPSMGGPGGPFSSPTGPDYNNMATSVPMESPTLLPGPQPQHNFTDTQQQLFRSAQQTQGGPGPQQVQLLTQQQYLAAQQQGLPPPAAFSAPYVINAQEPYVGTLITGPTAVIPQYYGVHWGVYPANIIQQQGPTAGGQPQRRPMSPTQTSEVSNQSNGNIAGNLQGQLSQYQVIPAYYDQNGAVVMRGVGNGAPVRLVSPAPVIINGANGAQAAAANNMRLLGSQAPQIGTPPASLYNSSQTPSLNSSQTFTGNTLADSLTQGLQTSNALTGNSNYSLGLQTSSLGFGNSTLGTIGSPAIGNLGGGLGGSSMNRRDSLDRTSSVLSPLSQDFRGGKWNAGNYGALGTVTASPGPIGLTSGSLTPPPSLSTSTALPIGALMSGNRVISAAPGAEAKFRNGSTNGMFNTTGGSTSASSSLFPPLKRNLSLDKCTGRSRLLEDFRNNRFPNLQLRDLANHIVEFSQDQHGSRFIQQKLEKATPAEKQMVFSEILQAAYSLMTDVFGNYVIQKFFEFGTPEQKTVLANKIRGHVLPLALQMYGCRVIQKALECISPEQQKEIVRELDGHVLKCVKDQNGNHVVQKCIESVDPMALQFIINAFQGQVFTLSTHPYGCRVIQRILEHCTMEQTTPILEELHQHTEQLLQDQYGNYVIQHVLEHGKPEDKSKIVGVVQGAVLNLSQHKFASNVVEKCVTHATRSERAMLIEECLLQVCRYNDGPHSSLLMLMKDQYANYVVQKMIDVAEPAQRKMLVHKIRPHFSTLRKYTYGKHILAKLEKFFLKNSPETIGPNMPTPL
ncbi:pumilio homolog 2-like isoform X3 [Oratosquilla oratoria]|uniref:pumilio homolog 2-like isoform X3 n=1 Tax=Oratosquilla oratoria TaxID=337810 RepID=UPI003F75A045